MFETDRLPNGWAARLNAVDEVWVPTEWARGVFAAQDHQLVAAQGVDLVDHPHDLQLGPQVHRIVVLGGQPILRRLAVLAHHDHRRLDRRQGREQQVQEDEGIGVEGQVQGLERQVQRHPLERRRREVPRVPLAAIGP